MLLVQIPKTDIAKSIFLLDRKHLVLAGVVGIPRLKQSSAFCSGDRGSQSRVRAELEE